MNARRAAKKASHVRVTARKTVFEAAGGERGCKGRLIFRPDASDDGDVQVVFALDELVHASHTEIRLARDIAHRCGGVADAREYALGRGDQIRAVGLDPARAPLL